MKEVLGGRSTTGDGSIGSHLRISIKVVGSVISSCTCLCVLCCFISSSSILDTIQYGTCVFGENMKLGILSMGARFLRSASRHLSMIC
jgi:hypothetical protein